MFLNYLRKPVIKGFGETVGEWFYSLCEGVGLGLGFCTALSVDVGHF